MWSEIVGVVTKLGGGIDFHARCPRFLIPKFGNYEAAYLCSLMISHNLSAVQTLETTT